MLLGNKGTLNRGQNTDERVKMVHGLSTQGGFSCHNLAYNKKSLLL